MGWVTIAPPGSFAGPCELPCTHVDCKHTRDLATTICRWCKEQIGYERPFYRDAAGAIHAACAWAEANPEPDQETILSEMYRSKLPQY